MYYNSITKSVLFKTVLLLLFQNSGNIPTKVPEFLFSRKEGIVIAIALWQSECNKYSKTEVAMI